MSDVLRDIESAAECEAERARLRAIYRRMPEVGGATIVRGARALTLLWYEGQLVLCGDELVFERGHYVKPVSTGEALARRPGRLSRQAIEWTHRTDARIRAEASAAGMELPENHLVRVIARAPHLWVVEGVEVYYASVLRQTLISLPRMYFMLPGVYALTAGWWVPPAELFERISWVSGIPRSVVEKYLRGKLPREEWEAAVAMARLAEM